MSHHAHGHPHLVGDPNAMRPTPMVYGPAKSKITPSELHMPVWPMNGKNHVIGPRGDQTMQYGNRSLLGSIATFIVSACRFSSPINITNCFNKRDVS